MVVVVNVKKVYCSRCGYKFSWWWSLWTLGKLVVVVVDLRKVDCCRCGH